MQISGNNDDCKNSNLISTSDPNQIEKLHILPDLRSEISFECRSLSPSIYMDQSSLPGCSTNQNGCESQDVEIEDHNEHNLFIDAENLPCKEVEDTGNDVPVGVPSSKQETKNNEDKSIAIDSESQGQCHKTGSLSVLSQNLLFFGTGDVQKTSFPGLQYLDDDDEVGPFKCHICNKLFKTKQFLHRHVKSHRNETVEEKYKCPHCRYSTNFQTNLNRHILGHTGEKPFSCHRCGKRFIQNYHLERHLLIHSGQKIHKCDMCDKSFLLAQYLKTHRRIHLKEKNHICDECGKAFVQSQDLNKHKKIHAKHRLKLQNAMSTSEEQKS